MTYWTGEGRVGDGGSHLVEFEVEKLRRDLYHLTQMWGIDGETAVTVGVLKELWVVHYQLVMMVRLGKI